MCRRVVHSEPLPQQGSDFVSEPLHSAVRLCELKLSMTRWMVVSLRVAGDDLHEVICTLQRGTVVSHHSALLTHFGETQKLDSYSPKIESWARCR